MTAPVEENMRHLEIALRNVVRAWDVLTEGDYSPRVVENWLQEHMEPPISVARIALKPDLDPPGTVGP